MKTYRATPGCSTAKRTIKLIAMLEKRPIYRHRNGLEQNDIEEGCFITDLTREVVHFLNPSAAAVFALCDGTRDAGAVAQILKDTFGLAIAPDDDVETCLASLAQQGLVEVQAGPH